jgi:hypothetical protein
MTHHDSLLPTFLLIPLSLPQVHIVMQRNFVTALPTVFLMKQETSRPPTDYILKRTKIAKTKYISKQKKDRKKMAIT